MRCVVCQCFKLSYEIRSEPPDSEDVCKRATWVDVGGRGRGMLQPSAVPAGEDIAATVATVAIAATTAAGR